MSEKKPKVKKRQSAPKPKLPVAGEKLQFGVHRLPHTDSETAPAWPPLAPPPEEEWP